MDSLRLSGVRRWKGDSLGFGVTCGLDFYKVSSDLMSRTSVSLFLFLKMVILVVISDFIKGLIFVSQIKPLSSARPVSAALGQYLA